MPLSQSPKPVNVAPADTTPVWRLAASGKATPLRSTTAAPRNEGTPSLPGPTPAKQHRFHLLDAIRGVAAVLVAARHAPPLAHLFPESFLAVDLFFALSGFVIAASYEHRLRTRMSVRTFTIARILRLYPLYLIGTVLGAAMLFTHNLARHLPLMSVPEIVTLLSALVFLPVFSTPLAMIFPLDPAAWSLFFEIVANIFYAFLVRHRVAMSGMLVAIAAISFAALARMSLLHHQDFDIGWNRMTFPIGFARVGYSFPIGVLLYRLYATRFRLHLSRISSPLVSIVVLLLVTLCLTATLPASFRPIYDLCMAVVALPVLVFVGACCGVGRRSAAVCAFLGDLSYPLYVLHETALFLFFLVQLRLHLPGSPMLWSALILLLFLPVAWAAGRFYDAPVRRYAAAKFS